VRYRVLSDPVFIGVLAGLVLFAAVLVTDRWARWVWLEPNQWWVELAFFGLTVFAGLLAKYWTFRKIARFWASLAILAAIHVVVVLLFMDYVRRIPLGAYIVILPIDVFGLIAFLQWSLREQQRDRVRSA
jgi:hypothetical protein